MQTKLTIECDIADAQAILYEAAKIIGKRAKTSYVVENVWTEYKLKCRHCGTVCIQRLNTDCGGCGRTLRTNSAMILGDTPFRSGQAEDKEGSGHV
jgi:hypothetical protein